MSMLKWLMWLQGERAAAKHEAEQRSGGCQAARAARPKEAVRDAKEQWDEDGDRADQDYHHVPGAGNPDRADPPVLNGKPLPKARQAEGGCQTSLVTESS